MKLHHENNISQIPFGLFNSVKPDYILITIGNPWHSKSEHNKPTEILNITMVYKIVFLKTTVVNYQ